jgi:hypothetical protein
VERPESGLVKQLNGDFFKVVSMEDYPTHPLTHHVLTLRSGVSAMLSISEFFQRVLEDDERKACPPTPDRHKIGFLLLSHSIQSIQDPIAPRHLGSQGRGGSSVYPLSPARAGNGKSLRTDGLVKRLSDTVIIV